MSPQVLTIPINTDADFEVDGQTVDALGNASAFTGALASDGLEAKVWQGDQTSVLFSPAVAWIDASVCKIKLTIAASQTATLKPGIWPIEVAWLPAGYRRPVWGGWIELTDAPGSGSAPATYSTFQDAIQYGGAWLKPLLMTQGLGSMLFDLARARSWLDEIILARARRRIPRRFLGVDPEYYGTVEAPDPILKGYLDTNCLMIRPRTIEICSHKAIALLCEDQFSGEAEDPYVVRANRHHALASRSLAGYKAEIDTNADGAADIVVPCGHFSIR